MSCWLSTLPSQASPSYPCLASLDQITENELNICYRDMITDSREDLTNSVAAVVKEQKGKFRGLDCNRGTKTVMKRWVSIKLHPSKETPVSRILQNLMHNDERRQPREKEKEEVIDHLESVSWTLQRVYYYGETLLVMTRDTSSSFWEISMKEGAKQYLW